MKIILELSIFFVFLAKMAWSHGYLSVPESRNRFSVQPSPHSLAGGGPWAIYGRGGYQRGMCGNSYTDSPQTFNNPKKPKDVYMEGSTIELEAVITAHHLGYFDVQVCDKADISDECFNKNRLMRYGCTDSSNIECYRLWIRASTSYSRSYILTSLGYEYPLIDSGTVTFKWKMQLPIGLSCSHCVLRWHWYTTNSCTNLYNPQNSISFNSEEFFNCADIRIESISGSTRDTSANPGTIQKLLSDRPRDLYSKELRNLNLWYSCPEESLGKAIYYDQAVSQFCFNSGIKANCEIPPFKENPEPNPLPPITTPSSTPLTSETSNPTNGGQSPGVCGSCKGCFWIPYKACYNDWDEKTCKRYESSQYVYCGGNSGGNPTETLKPTQIPTQIPTQTETLKPTQTPIPSETPTTTEVNPTPPNPSGNDKDFIDRLKNTYGGDIFKYQKPDLTWEVSTLYNWEDMVKAAESMIVIGIGKAKLWAGDGNHKYGLVNIAAFIAQAMQETIRYNACDENNWSDQATVNLAGSGSIYSSTSACGQMNQMYSEYTCSEEEDRIAMETGGKPMACQSDPNMIQRALTYAKWWGAPPALFCAPRSIIPKAPRWDYLINCWGANTNPFSDRDSSIQYFNYVRNGGKCQDFLGLKDGGWVYSGEGCTDAGCPGSKSLTGVQKFDLEGCCWWGRGVIQTTGVCNYGKLNYYLGKRAADEGRTSLYPNYDFCADPGLVCNGEGSIKWVSGFFFHINAVQSYNNGGWNYIEQLKKWVDRGMSINDRSFIDSVSGIVNRGCHNPPCATGDTHAKQERYQNFVSVIKVMGLV